MDFFSIIKDKGLKAVSKGYNMLITFYNGEFEFRIYLPDGTSKTLSIEELTSPNMKGQAYKVAFIEILKQLDAKTIIAFEKSSKLLYLFIRENNIWESIFKNKYPYTYKYIKNYNLNEIKYILSLDEISKNVNKYNFWKRYYEYMSIDVYKIIQRRNGISAQSIILPDEARWAITGPMHEMVYGNYRYYGTPNFKHSNLLKKYSNPLTKVADFTIKVSVLTSPNDILPFTEIYFAPKAIKFRNKDRLEYKYDTELEKELVDLFNKTRPVIRFFTENNMYKREFIDDINKIEYIDEIESVDGKFEYYFKTLLGNYEYHFMDGQISCFALDKEFFQANNLSPISS